jgi:DNA replication protein DnaC
MANKARIKEMAMELNLQTLADAKLEERSMGNLDYLELVLSKEIESRRQHAVAKARKNCNLPNAKFVKEKLNKGVQYQIEKLLSCDWLAKNRNLLVTGECGTGKTALAAYLASNAIEKGFKVYYCKLDDLLAVVKQKEVLPKASATFNRIKNADLLVLDEVLYLNIPKDDLELLYKTVMFLNDTTSIIFITNREISDWLKTAEDKYTMRLLISRAVENSEVVRIHKT